MPKCKNNKCRYPRANWWKKTLGVDWLASSGEAVETVLKIWLYGDPHVKRDKDNGRDSLGSAITQIEAETDYDFGLSVGDYAGDTADGHQFTDAEGAEILAQYGASEYGRERFYQIMGNHDANDSDAPEGENWVFRKYIDPAGENPSTSGVVNANRPYPIVGTYLRYYVPVGNTLFLKISDYNHLPLNEGGRGTEAESQTSGYPTGGWSLEAYEWVTDVIFKNLDKNIILLTHHALRDSTLVSGWKDSDSWNNGIHGDDPTNDGAEGYLCYIGTHRTDYAGQTRGSSKIHDLFRNSSGLISAWLHGHDHYKVGDIFAGKAAKRDSIYGFVVNNIANLTKYWSSNDKDPKSWLLTIQGTNANFRQYLHMESVDGHPIGWYDPSEFDITLPNNFVTEYEEPTPTEPNAPTGLTFTRGTDTSAWLNWTGDSDGYLIIRRSGAAPTGVPSDDNTYAHGETLGDGTVVFIGTRTDFEDYGLTNGTTYHYAVYPFNGRGGSIVYGSPVTGSHTIAQSSVYIYDEFRDNVPNYAKWAILFPNRNLDAYFLVDDNQLIAHCEHQVQIVTTSILGTQSCISLKNIPSTRAQLVFDFEVPDRGANNNPQFFYGMYNNTTTPQVHERNSAAIAYGIGGADALNLRVWSNGSLVYNQQIAYQTGKYKIDYNHTTTTTTFYRWDGDSWESIGSHVASFGATRTMKVMYYLLDETTYDGATECRVGNVYFTNTDVTGIKPT